MGDAKGQEDEGPTLELPSLFRRRRKTADAPAADSTAAPTAAPVADEQPEAPRAAEPTVVLPEPSPELAPDPEPAAVDPEPVAVEPEPVVVDPVPEPGAVEPEPEPVAVAESVIAEPDPESVALVEPEPVVVDPVPEPEPADEAPTEVLPPPSDSERTSLRDKLQLRRAAPRGGGATPLPASEPPATEVADSVEETRPRRVRPIEPRTGVTEKSSPAVPVGERVRNAVPEMAPEVAAAVVGAVVGLLGCIVTWVGLQGCEVVTGAQTCGGPGLLILVAIVVGQILVGAALLKMVGVPEAGNLSFLGVGIMVVITLMVLIDYLYEGWMFAAIPVVTALSFLVARWVTTKYADDSDDYPVEQHDVR